NYFAKISGKVKIFRPWDPMGNIGEFAAKVARLWAPKDDKMRKMPFSKSKGFLSALRSSSYDSGAKARAAQFRQYSNIEGGPPNLETGVGEKSMFCSMFVIACYQAVFTTDAATAPVMGLDAQATSPMTLDGYLRSNTTWWKEVNAQPSPE